MNPAIRNLALGVGAILATVVAVGWTWRTLNAPPAINLALHRGVGQRLAQEIAQSVGPKGSLVVVTLPRGTSAVVDAQLDAFQTRLGQWPGWRVARTDEVDTSKGDKYGPGTGMSARRWQRLAEKHAEVPVSGPGGGDPGIVRGQERHPQHPDRLRQIARRRRAAFSVHGRGRRSIYTCPIKALVNEKWMALCREFGPDNVGFSTGDATVNRDAPILCCTAEILANIACAKAPRRTSRMW
jgi:hypothetical protein